MKYHIDTIPVWDALHTGSECPLCALRRRTERLLVERNLGGAVMSPDTRLKVNDKGFCGHHQAMLYAQPGGNRLGHGLMMLSRLQTLRPQVSQALAERKAQGSQNAARRRLFSGRDAAKPAAGGMAGFYASCLICEELASQNERQTASLLHLWKTDKAFQTAYSNSRGLCLPHTDQALAMADRMLSGESLAGFQELTSGLLESSLQRLEEELSWFTQKFDYRNAQKPWGESRDALERTANKLQGWCLGSEPMQDEA